MLRLATILTVLAAAIALLAAPPASAGAAGCEVLREPAERAECVAREQARIAARAEVERRASGGARAARTANGSTAAWQRALEEGDAPDPGALLDTRLLAAVGGLTWFFLVLRARRRRRQTSLGS